MPDRRRGKGGKAHARRRATTRSAPAAPRTADASGGAAAASPPRVFVPTPPDDFAVVGVGASAGGLEAFTNLLRAIPPDSTLAIVLVQHRARGHESLLPDLLSQATPMPVVKAEDGMRIRPGHVYVIPPDARMTVTDGHLRVISQPNVGGAAVPVDHFFRSLAEHYREKAIGVVLSGGASDGAAGIREIKAVGGITIAQDPGEAGIDSMPRSSIATGAIDLVLPVAGIANELVHLSEHPFLRSAGEDLMTASDTASGERLGRVFQILRRANGVDFSQYKWPTVVRRIQRRMALHRIARLADYLTLLEESPGEAENLYEDVLIHVTSFFREPESYEALKESVFPELLAGHQETGTPIRIWVPGCSSGEEVYSMAIALHEFLGNRAAAVPTQLFGTDVSQKMIDFARAGVYSENIAADVRPERLRRCFVKQDGGYRIGRSIRDACVFARQDLTRDPPFSKLGLVVCRNLLIYLGQPLQRKVIEVFHYALRSNGFLMLGRSETTGAHADLFALGDKKFKIYRKKADRVAREIGFSAPVSFETRAGAGKTHARLAREPARPTDVLGEANRLILDRYGPPGVIVDSSLRVVRTRGRTSPFLELPSGDASLEVLKLARQGLLFGLRSAVAESRASGRPVRKERLRVAGNGDPRLVNIDITPVGSAADRHFLVLFEEEPLPDGAKAESKSKSRSRSAAKQKDKASSGRTAAEEREQRKNADNVLRQLEDELDANRQYLQSNISDLEAANEELQSANEEILSSNEELQSTNEELDTAKEELQSTNEELSTLNDELHGRNEELSRANSDLTNLLASVHIPIVIVSSDLRIRRFTPAAEKVMNLIAADIGRPIGHIKPNIHVPDLQTMVAEVIDSITAREREVEDDQGMVYLLRVRPYKNVEDRIDGAVVTLFDVSTVRGHENDLKVARDIGTAIMSAAADPVLMLGADLCVQQANRAFQEAFRIAGADIVGKLVYDLGDHAWDFPAVHTLLDGLLAEQKSFDGVVVEHDFTGLGLKRLELAGRRIESARPGGKLLVLVIRDVTGQAPGGGDERH